MMDTEVPEDHESAGRVSYRSRNSGRSATVPNSSRWINQGTPRSTQQYSSRGSDSVHGSDIFPPNLDGPSHEGEPSSTNFKSWLTSGILDVLGAAAGATISTTGKIVAPPLEMTRTLLLPGLLALIVDTLDAITPPRVQDWFRILSSSVYHLMVVLGSTEQGKEFSTQFYVVLQDALQAVSAPESRQVLVDGMATSVKFAEALHTPETKALLDQLGILSVRLADAASSGKTKQFFQDSMELAWQGIEMAADPATTLALAEVTAHLCHALDDAQQSLNPGARADRNSQNQKVYLHPCQMLDFPEQVTMEQIILSCLGLDDEDDCDDGTSMPSKLTIDDDFSVSEPVDHDWRERGEQVNVDFLKEKILKRKRAPLRVQSNTVNPVTDGFSNLNETGCETSIYKNSTKASETESGPERSVPLEQDMEDICCAPVPGGRKSKVKAKNRATTENASSAILTFYERLDQFLEQSRDRSLPVIATEHQEPVNKSQYIARGIKEQRQSWKAKIKKFRHSRPDQSTESSNPSAPNRMLRRSHIMILVIVINFVFFSVLFSCFALYGAYSLLTTSMLRKEISTIPQQEANAEKSSREEIVIRVIREVVHVRDGEGASENYRRLQGGLDSIVDTLDVSLGEDGIVQGASFTECGLSSAELSAITENLKDSVVSAC